MVFKDELPNLLPNNQDAKRMREQTFVPAEFLNRHASNFVIPKLPQKALAHGHCHQKALIKMSVEEQIFKKLGLNYEILDSGCCGMEGAFGFEAAHYETFMKIGELGLLPAVREAAKSTLFVADGFRCREQIAQTTDRQALHLAASQLHPHGHLHNSGANLKVAFDAYDVMDYKPAAGVHDIAAPGFARPTVTGKFAGTRIS